MEMLRAGGGKVHAPAHEPSVLDRLVEGQDEAGISTQILSTGPHSPYLRDEASAVACAREVNDRYFDVVE